MKYSYLSRGHISNFVSYDCCFRTLFTEWRSVCESPQHREHRFSTPRSLCSVPFGVSFSAHDLCSVRIPQTSFSLSLFLSLHLSISFSFSTVMVPVTSFSLSLSLSLSLSFFLSPSTLFCALPHSLPTTSSSYVVAALLCPIPHSRRSSHISSDPLWNMWLL